MATSITAPFNGYLALNGVCRVYLTGTGPVGSQIWVVSLVRNFTTGAEIPNSRCLAAFVILDSTNQGKPVQISSPISVPSFYALSGNSIGLELLPETSGGAVITDCHTSNDGNGVTNLYISSQNQVGH